METKRKIPSPSMGEYSYLQPTSDKEGLYPFIEEGTYGRVPRREQAGRWSKPDPYTKRERKPKIYASYAISDKCELHSVVLDKYDSRQLRRTTSPCQLRSTTPPRQLPSTTPHHHLRSTTPPRQLRSTSPPTENVISHNSARVNKMSSIVSIHPNKKTKHPSPKFTIKKNKSRRKLNFDGEDEMGELNMLDKLELVRQLEKSTIESLRDEVEVKNIIKGGERKDNSVKSSLEHKVRNNGLKNVEEKNVGSYVKEKEQSIGKDKHEVKEDDDINKSKNTEENLLHEKIEMVKEMKLLFFNSLMETQVEQETFVSSLSLNIKDDGITTHVV